MRSAVTFLALMTTGVLIVMIYIWSGESIAALIMAIVTMFAILAIVQWRPWAIEDLQQSADAFRGRSRRDGGRAGSRNDGRSGGGSRGGGRSARRDGGRRSRRTTGGHDDGEPDDGDRVWRAGFDITWDRRGISGVAVHGQAPQLWSWSQIDDIGLAWSRAEPAAGADSDPAPTGRGFDRPTPIGDRDGADHDPADQERLVLCLDFPSLRNPEEPARAEVMFGPDQDPDDLLRRLRSGWRDSKVPRSRLFDLSAEERTRKLAEHFAGRPDQADGVDGVDGSPDIDLTRTGSSPELLYQEIRRALLSSGELCRLAPDAGFDDVLDGFDDLLEVHGAEPLTRTEATELAAVDGPDRVAALHWTLDGMAEQRGFRVAFIDHGGDDYLLGLIPAHAADDWDGQSIGSGSARVVLDLPT